MANTKKKALGKGLSALISEGNDEIAYTENLEDDLLAAFAEDADDLNVKYIKLTDLRAGTFQPREYFDEEKLQELALSIKENGVIQPILVRWEEEESVYQIVAGERRWRAAKQAGLEVIPAVIRNLTDKEAAEAALIENIQRQSLTAIEEAEGYKTLQEHFSYTQEQLAERLGKSRSHIANMLRLLTLPKEVKELINTRAISMGHARALIKSNNPIEDAYKIIENGLSVREAEKFTEGNLRKNGINSKKNSSQSSLHKKSKDEVKDEDIVVLETSLSRSLGLKVTINCDKEVGGIVSVCYNNMSELDRILQKLG